MNKVIFYFIFSITTLFLFSCSKSEDTIEVVPLREFQAQYDTDIETINEYLNNYYLDMDLTDPTFADKEVVMTKIPVGGTQPNLMSYVNATTYPKLLKRVVNLHGVDYEIYYLVLRKGEKNLSTGLGGVSPTNVDGVLASYSGSYLYKTTGTDTVDSVLSAVPFETVIYPQSFFSLYTTIVGWSEIFPQFKTGSYKSEADGTISYSGFGSGVMFIPSGLAYFSNASGGIPAYSPLVFSFKLYEVKRLDQEIKMVSGSTVSDPDGVPSYLEDLNGDGYIYDYRSTVSYPIPPTDAIRYADDTDKDGIPDFIDIDDDGDGFTTKIEISKGTDYLDKNSHP